MKLNEQRLVDRTRRDQAEVGGPHVRLFPPAGGLARLQPEADSIWESHDRGGTHDTVVAELQVDRLVWPPITNRLLESCAAELEGWSSQILSAAGLGKRIIGFSSYRRGEGRETMMLVLARLLIRGGAKVAILDADFSQARLARNLGVLPETGWEHVLSGQARLASALVYSDEDRLALLPLVERRPESADLARAPVMVATLRQLRRSFDLVLADCGTLQERRRGGAYLLDSAEIDHLIIVRDVRITGARDFEEGLSLAHRLGIPDGEVVENFAPLS